MNLKIKIRGENGLTLTDGHGNVAAAEVRKYSTLDYGDQRTVDNMGDLADCPASMRPMDGTPIWAVTTNYSGCFWARSLALLETHLERDFRRHGAWSPA